MTTAGPASCEETMQRTGMLERGAMPPAPSSRRLGRLEASQPIGRPGLSWGVAGDPQAGPRRGAPMPPLRCLGERRRSHPAGVTRRDA
jgi:hypothetical protein